MGVLSHAISVAARMGMAACTDLDEEHRRTVRNPRGRVRFLDDAERARLLDALLRIHRRVLYLAGGAGTSTGARHGELISTGIRWISPAKPSCCTTRKTVNAAC